MNVLRVAVLTAVVAAPGWAAAAPLSPGLVFADAGVISKLIMVGLLIAMAAAVVVCVRKLASGKRLSGGSAYLSSLRAGGPLAGLLGGAWVMLIVCIGLANAPAPPPLQVVAPGLAEAMLLVTLGMLAGAVAAAAHWAVEARVDRAVLSA